MTREQAITAISIVVVIGVSALVYSISECGWSALAYGNPFIAAVTGVCK